jgi:amidase
VFNVLDYSGLTFPVSTVKESDSWENFPRPSTDYMSPEDELYQTYYESGVVGSRKYANAPVSLQLVGRRFAEEKLLGVLERIVENLKDDEGVRSKL